MSATNAIAEAERLAEAGRETQFTPETARKAVEAREAKRSAQATEIAELRATLAYYEAADVDNARQACIGLLVRTAMGDRSISEMQLRAAQTYLREIDDIGGTEEARVSWRQLIARISIPRPD